MRAFINALGNSFVPRLLKSPLHFLISGRVMLISFTGRKSGKSYTTPVEYVRDNDRVIFFTQRKRAWWKNLQNGADVTVRIEGIDLHGQAQVITNADVIDMALATTHPGLKIDPAQMVMLQITLSKVTAGYASASV